MEEISVCLDVGGTNVKGMIFSEDNVKLFDEIKYYRAYSESSAEEIINNLYHIIVDLIESIPDKNYLVTFIGLAFPGPFDYQKGVSYIKELGKYDSLYGLNIKKLLLKKITNMQSSQFKVNDIVFMNDATAFAKGENYLSGVTSGAYFTIGTGLGSTFIEKKRIIKGIKGIPSHGMVYDVKFKESIIDDYISARGLEELSAKYCGYSIDGKELFNRAANKDPDALKTFQEFGVRIGEALSPFIKSFQPDEIVFGGQISKSFTFFSSKMIPYFPYESELRVSEDTSYSILIGLLMLNKTLKNKIN